MKLLSFRWKDRDRLGFALDDDRIIDLGEIAAALGREPYADMLALIEAGDAGTGFLRDAQAFAKDQPAKLTVIPASEIVYYPPVRRPSKICGVALPQRSAVLT